MHSDFRCATGDHVCREPPERRRHDHLVVRQPCRTLTVPFTQLLETLEEFGVSRRDRPRPTPDIVSLGIDCDQEEGSLHVWGRPAVMPSLSRRNRS
jgi:hypothetical protein